MMNISKKYAWIMDSLSHTPFSVKARAMKHFLTGKKEYITKKNSNADIESIVKCSLCPNMCRFDCPVSEAEKNETLSPSARARIAYLFEMGFLEGEDVTEALYSCCNCDACRQWCPFEFSLGDILRGVHRDLVEKNNLPKQVSELRETIKKKHVTDDKSFNIAGKHNGDLLYFMGCTVMAKHESIAVAMTKIMEKAGEKWAILEDEWCCGAPLYNLGFIEDFIDIAEKNVLKIKETGCKELICSCPTCAYIFKEIYPKFKLNVGVKILHATEYLARLDKPYKISKEFEINYVYHDPCTLVRKLGIVEQPRHVLNKIKGLKLKEPYFHDKDTQCCGRGGSLATTYPSISEKITKKRLEELSKYADFIITSCPTCKSAFSNLGGKVYDISELIYAGCKTDERQ